MGAIFELNEKILGRKKFLFFFEGVGVCFSKHGATQASKLIIKSPFIKLLLPLWLMILKKLGAPPPIPSRSQFYPNLGAAAKLTLMSRITDAHESLPPLGSVTTSVRQHVSTYLESRGRRYMGRHHFVNSALCTTSVGLGGSRTLPV